MNRKPNLFVIGAMKSGTTSLCNYLGCHPDIFMSKLKEPMHFSRVEHWSFGNEKYLSLFADAKAEAYVGEGSTEYTKLPSRKGVAQRLYDFSPRARLIYLMRDPFKRILSQYKHMVRAKRETRLLSDAIKGCFKNGSGHTDYLSNSYYAYQLLPYLELFGNEALFLGTFEEFVASPEDFCRKIFAWLDIDQSFALSQYPAYNVSPENLLFIDEYNAFTKIILELNKLIKTQPIIKAIIPGSLRIRLFKALPKMSIDFTSKEFQLDIVTTRDALAPFLSDWIKELEHLTGLSYRMWPSRNVCIDSQSSSITNLTNEISHHLKSLIDPKDHGLNLVLSDFVERPESQSL